MAKEIVENAANNRSDAYSSKEEDNIEKLSKIWD